MCWRGSGRRPKGKLNPRNKTEQNARLGGDPKTLTIRETRAVMSCSLGGPFALPRRQVSYFYLDHQLLRLSNVFQLEGLRELSQAQVVNK